MPTIHYSIRRASRLELEISATFPGRDENGETLTEIHLPTWRPGRYELGNFGQYVFNMAQQIKGRWQPLQKSGLHSWSVAPTNELTVRYRFRAHKMDAGSTWADDNVLYVNPVNCLTYHPQLAQTPCKIELPDVPEGWKLACQLTDLMAENMQQLMDSPLIAAPAEDLRTDRYRVDNVDFHIHSWGRIHHDPEAFKRDHEAFTKKQLAAFGACPVSTYHFMYLFPPFAARHGVEHEASTVIAMGPSERMKEPAFLEETLAIGSHELVHTWNVKSLRPAEWTPYDFSGVSPSRLGYVAEGVTTYFGDLFLYEAGVIDLQGWTKRFGAYIQKHLWNPGRLTTSLADSGYDTWLDGYARPGGPTPPVPPVPHRVGNIYVEGLVLAFLCDVELHQASGRWLVEAIRTLWENSQAGPEHRGLTEKAYWDLLTAWGGPGIKRLRDRYCDGTPQDSWDDLCKGLAHQGVKAELRRNANELHAAGALTRKQQDSEGREHCEVVSVWPNSPAWEAGLVPGALIHDVNRDSDAGFTRVEFVHAGRDFDEKLPTVDGQSLPSSFSQGYFPKVELTPF